MTIDGELRERILKDKPRKFSLTEGEHFIQGKTLGSNIEYSKVAKVENGKQIIVRMEFPLASGEEAEKRSSEILATSNESFIKVAELNLTLNGGANVLIEEVPGEYSSNTDLYFAFEKGDIIQLDGNILNKKGKFFIELYSYPDGNLVFSKDKLLEIKNQRIKINERGIYNFVIGTTAILDKRIDLTIKRKPKDETTENSTQML